MINCSNCGKENQDHYKFCLGCGARLAGAPVVVPATQPVRAGGTVVTPPSAVTSDTNTAATPSRPSIPPLVTASAVDPARPIAAPSAVSTAPANCPGCGMVNPPGFLFCGRCGSRLGGAGSSDADEPLVTTMAAPLSPGAGAIGMPPSNFGPAVAPGGTVVAAGGTVVSPARKPGLRASMHLLREDGSEGGTLHLEDGPVPFGRDYGPPFDTDFYLNPRHCAFTVAADGVRVDDLSPVNGVYRKIEGTIELQHGDTFRVGQELLYYEDLPEPEVLPDGTERMGSPNPGYWGRVSVLVETGRACEAMPVVGAEFTIGRERGDLTFPTDGYVSSAHCRIIGDDSGVYLEDRGSSNGTYLRVRTGTVVPFGSLVLIGQQLFHVRKA